MGVPHLPGRRNGEGGACLSSPMPSGAVEGARSCPILSRLVLPSGQGRDGQLALFGR